MTKLGRMVLIAGLLALSARSVAAQEEGGGGEDEGGAGVGAGVGAEVGGVGAEGSAEVGTGDTGGAEAAPEGQAEAQAPEEEKQQGRVDAGGKLRFPSGPDDTGMEYGLFNWIALDLRAQYGISDALAAGVHVPLAIKKPEGEFETLGGFTANASLRLFKLVGVGVRAGMMRQGAFLLTPYDAPVYVGDLKMGAALGPSIALRTGVVDVAAALDVVLQLDSAGEMMDETLTAVALPISAMVQVRDLIKVGAETGVYTGHELKLGAEDGGRIPLTANVSLKLGRVILNLGAGFATLITSDTGGLYPGIGDSLFVGLNAKWASK